MANSEDYLDGLLNSISKAKTDVDMASRREQMEQEEKIRRRTQISPDDDFMSAQGLYDYEPRRTKRENLRRAFSESAFLEDFENEFELEMSDEDEDEFLEEFEKSLREVQEEEADSLEDPTVSGRHEVLPDGEEVSPLYDGMGDADDNSDQEPVDALMENIASIVSEAKQKAQDDVITDGVTEDGLMEEPLEAAPDLSAGDPKEIGDMDFADNLLGEADRMAAQSRGNGIAGDDFLQPEFEPDEHDGAMLTEENADGEITLLDPTVDGDDLLSMLSSGEDGDLMDIGDLLSADEGGQELSEAREAYEEGAAAAEEGLDDDTLSLDDFDESEKKGGIGGFFANIIGAITGIFSKFGKKGGGEEGESEPVVDPTAEELAAESDDILAEFANEEAAAEAPPEEPKKKEKKEKPKKEKKEKPKKEKKPPKEKKPKVPDKSPKVPLKVILIFVLLAASIVAFILVVQHVLPQKAVNRNARTAFANKEYFKCYSILDETNVSGDKEVLLLNKSRIMAQMELRYKGYEAGMKQQKYLYALDSLIIGFHFYEYNADTASELEITDIYDELGSKFASALADQYGLTPDDARELFAIESRKVYTRRLKEIVKELGLVSKGE